MWVSDQLLAPTCPVIMHLLGLNFLTCKMGCWGRCRDRTHVTGGSLTGLLLTATTNGARAREGTAETLGFSASHRAQG